MQSAFYRHRRCMFAALTAVYVSEMFCRNALSVARLTLEYMFSLDSVSFGFLGGAYFCGQMAGLIPSGILADYYSPQKVVLGGTCCMAAGSVLFSLAWNFPLLFLGRSLVGLGGILIFPAYIKILGLWYSQKEHAIMTGVASGLSYASGMLALAPLSLLMRFTSWRVLFLGLAGVLLVFLVVNCFLWAATPEKAGCQALLGTDGLAQGARVSAWQMLVELGRLLTFRKVWLPLVAVFTIFGTFTALTGVWGVSFLSQAYGFSTSEASGLLTYTMAAAAFSSLLVPMLSQRLGSRRIPAVLCCCGLGICWALLAYFAGGSLTAPVLALLLTVAGMFQGVTTLYMLLFKELYPVSCAGMAITIYSIGCNLGGCVVPALVGVAYQQFGGGTAGFRGAFWMCFLLLIIGLFCAFLQRPTAKTD